MPPAVIRPFPVTDARVKVIEDDLETTIEHAGIEVLAKTAKLFRPQFDDDGNFVRMVTVDTLRQVHVSAGAGGHKDFIGISDKYIQMGLEGEDAEVTWRVWAQPPVESK